MVGQKKKTTRKKKAIKWRTEKKGESAEMG